MCGCWRQPIKILEEEIEKGNFRADLFWRLNVVPLQVPRLCDRLEDIPFLVQDLIKGLAAKGLGQKEFSDGAYQALMTHSWPGNVRELRNFIERLVIMCPSPVISEQEIHHFLTPGIAPATTSGATHDQSGLLPYLAADFQEAKKSFERYYLQLKLSENEGNISQTAEQIGMDRSHLHKNLKACTLSLKADRPKAERLKVQQATTVRIAQNKKERYSLFSLSTFNLISKLST